MNGTLRYSLAWLVRGSPKAVTLVSALFSPLSTVRKNQSQHRHGILLASIYNAWVRILLPEYLLAISPSLSFEYWHCIEQARIPFPWS